MKLSTVLHSLQFNESPVFFLMTPTVDATRKELPVLLLESEVHMVEGAPEVQFARARYTIDTSEAERIAVDQVAKMVTTENASASAQVSGHLQQLKTAVTTMQQQLGRVLAYVGAVQRGEAAADHAVLRRISALGRALPIASSDKLELALDQEYTDAQLVTYLAALTRGVSAVQEYSEHVALPISEAGGRSGVAAVMRAVGVRGGAFI